MKQIFAILFLWSGFLHATAQKPANKRAPTNEAAKVAPFSASATTIAPMTAPPPTNGTTVAQPVATSSTLLVTAPLEPTPMIHLSTNFVDFTMGKSNFLIDFFNFKKRFHINIRSYSSAEQEAVDKSGTKRDLTVNRSALGLGFTWYAHDISAAKNWVVSPALVFGKTDDSLDSTSQAGIGLKATALFRIGDRMSFEAGLLSDTVHASHRNALHLGFGYFL